MKSIVVCKRTTIGTCAKAAHRPPRQNHADSSTTPHFMDLTRNGHSGCGWFNVKVPLQAQLSCFIVPM